MPKSTAGLSSGGLGGQTKSSPRQVGNFNCHQWGKIIVILHDGLRLLEKEALLKRISVGSLAELEAKLLQAAESLDAGRGVDGEEVFARLRKRSKTRRTNA
jgi:hypothetical protein